MAFLCFFFILALYVDPHEIFNLYLEYIDYGNEWPYWLNTCTDARSSDASQRELILFSKINAFKTVIIVIVIAAAVTANIQWI